MCCYSFARWYVITQLILIAPPFLRNSLDFPETSLDTLEAILVKAGFEPYITSVGGSGLGVLSSYVYDNHPSTVTPPETPSPDGSLDGSDTCETVEPFREAFEGKPREELVEWATHRGEWLYV